MQYFKVLYFERNLLVMDPGKDLEWHLPLEQKWVSPLYSEMCTSLAHPRQFNLTVLFRHSH